MGNGAIAHCATAGAAGENGAYGGFAIASPAEGSQTGFQRLPPDLQASIDTMILNYFGANPAGNGGTNGAAAGPGAGSGTGARAILGAGSGAVAGAGASSGAATAAITGASGAVASAQMAAQAATSQPYYTGGAATTHAAGCHRGAMALHAVHAPKNFETDLANGTHISLSPQQVNAIDTLRKANPPVQGNFRQLQAMANDPSIDPEVRDALKVVLKSNDCRNLLDSAARIGGASDNHLDGIVGEPDFDAIRDMPGWRKAASEAGKYMANGAGMAGMAGMGTAAGAGIAAALAEVAAALAAAAAARSPTTQQMQNQPYYVNDPDTMQAQASDPAATASQAATAPKNFETDLANGTHISLTPEQVSAIQTLGNAQPPVQGNFRQLQAKAEDPNTDPAIKAALQVVLKSNDARNLLDSAARHGGASDNHLDGIVGKEDYDAIGKMPGWQDAVTAAAQNPAGAATTAGTATTAQTPAADTMPNQPYYANDPGTAQAATGTAAAASPAATTPKNFETDLANGTHISLTPEQVTAIETLANAIPPVHGNLRQLEAKANDLKTSPAVRDALHVVLKSNDARNFLDSAARHGGAADNHLDGVVGKADFDAISKMPGWHDAVSAAKPQTADAAATA